MPTINPDLNILTLLRQGAMITITFDADAVHVRKPKYRARDATNNLLRVLAVAMLTNVRTYALIFSGPIDPTKNLIIRAKDPAFRSTIDAAPCDPAGYVTPGTYPLT